MDKLSYDRVVPVQYEYDVPIVGGDPAGCAAAIAAARQGVRVLLIESQYCLEAENCIWVE